MNRELLATIWREKPDLVFFVPHTDQFILEVVDEINHHTITLGYLFDDTWRIEYSRFWDRHFKFVTTSDVNGLRKFREAGFANVIYSPFACNTNVYCKKNLPKIYDVTFVGQYHPHREWYINCLKKAGIDVRVWGMGWSSNMINTEDMINIFNQSRINMNLSNCVSWDIRYLLTPFRPVKTTLRTWRQGMHAVTRPDRKTWEMVKGRYYEIRFISRLVGKSLNDLQGEVTEVMEAIGLPFDDFDLVIDPFQLSGMNRIVAVIQDSVPVATQGFGKLDHIRMLYGSGQGTPFLQGLLGPGPGSVGPDVFQFVFEDQNHIDDFVQAEELFQVLTIFKSPDIGPVSQEKVFGTFEDLFVGLGGFPVFAVSHFIDDPVELGHDMKKVENDLDMGDFCLDGQDIGVPHIHHHGFQMLPLLPAHAREKSLQGSRFAVLADPNHPPRLVVENHRQVAVTFADRDFVHSQDAEPSIVGLPIGLFQEVLVDGLDRFPVQSQMAGDFLDGHDLRQFEDIACQPLGHPQVGMKNVELFERSLPALSTDDLPVLTADPDPRRTEVQIADPPSLPAVNSTRRLSTEMADGTESLVGHRLQVSFLGIGGHLLPDDPDSREGKIV